MRVVKPLLLLIEGLIALEAFKSRLEKNIVKVGQEIEPVASWCKARVERPEPPLPKRCLVFGRPFHGIHLSLREGDGDVVLLEGGPDLLTQFTADVQRFKGISNRKSELVGNR